MPNVKVFNMQGAEVGEIALSDEIFGVEPHVPAMHAVVRAYLNAQRQGTQSTLNREEVRGGGRKIYRQKGTGNARQGSNRSPIMRGGAIIFGPQPREYGFKINKKVRSLALRMALSSRLADNELMVVKGIELPEAKTKHFAKVAGTLGLSKALVVVAPEQGGEGSVLALSARNIPGITLVTPDAVNVYEVLNHKQLVVLEGALPHLEARLK